MRSVGAALRPQPAPLAVSMAARTALAAGTVTVVGAVVGDLNAVGMAYFGAACAVAFAARGTYRLRSWALLAQAGGAVVGLTIGALVPDQPATLIAAAAVAGVISGVIGVIGPNAPAFGMMLTIGLAFGEFGGSPLPSIEQSLWYLVGTLIVAVATLFPWVFHRGGDERTLVAAVFDSAAAVCDDIGSSEARAARARLARASADARSVTHHPRAELVAFAVAGLYAEENPMPRSVSDLLRAAADATRRGEPLARATMKVENPTPAMAALFDAFAMSPTRPPAPGRPGRHDLMRSALRAIWSLPALGNGMRLGLCLAMATGTAVALHDSNHAFWLPLTVAVIVRPEYASVFVRTVNRVCGTIAGAAFAAAILAVFGSGLPVACAAALALSVAVLTAPKLYAFSVIGITGSALLASCIGTADPALPALRLVDTVIGAGVAIVFGYLLWPDSRRLPTTARLDAALPAVQAYLEEAVKQPARRVDWQTRRDEAYRQAHLLRAATEAATTELPPVSSIAVFRIPVAVELEELVDAITALAAKAEAGHDVVSERDRIEQRLRLLESLPLHSHD